MHVPTTPDAAPPQPLFPPGDAAGCRLPELQAGYPSRSRGGWGRAESCHTSRRRGPRWLWYWRHRGPGRTATRSPSGPAARRASRTSRCTRGYREDPCDGEVRVAHPVVVPHDNGGGVSQPPNSGAPSSRRVVRQLALGPAEVLLGAGTPAKVPRKFWGTEFWESTGQTPGESAPQILGHRGLGLRTPNPTG